MGGDPKTVMLLLKANADPTLRNKVCDTGINVDDMYEGSRIREFIFHQYGIVPLSIKPDHNLFYYL